VCADAAAMQPGEQRATRQDAPSAQVPQMLWLLPNMVMVCRVCLCGEGSPALLSEAKGHIA